jgi:hypothetical protein
VVAACIGAGLVGGEGFAVDASLIEADANKSPSIPGSDWNKEIDPERASRAANEYLATLEDAAYGAATTVVPKFVSPSDPAAPRPPLERAHMHPRHLSRLLLCDLAPLLPIQQTRYQPPLGGRYLGRT